MKYWQPVLMFPFKSNVFILIIVWINTDKPFILYTDSNPSTLKISARIHQSLVDKGIDLAEILKEIHDKMFTTDYLSGGHKPAAGGYIPTEKIEPYIELINKKIGEKLT